MSLTDKRQEYNTALLSQHSDLGDRQDELMRKAWAIHKRIGQGYSGPAASNKALEDMIRLGEIAGRVAKIRDGRSAMMTLYIKGEDSVTSEGE